MLTYLLLLLRPLCQVNNPACDRCGGNATRLVSNSGPTPEEAEHGAGRTGELGGPRLIVKDKRKAKEESISAQESRGLLAWCLVLPCIRGAEGGAGQAGELSSSSYFFSDDGSSLTPSVLMQRCLL